MRAFVAALMGSCPYRFEDHIAPWTNLSAPYTQHPSPVNTTFLLAYDYDEYVKSVGLGVTYNDFIGNFTLTEYRRTAEGNAPRPHIVGLSQLQTGNMSGNNQLTIRPSLFLLGSLVVLSTLSLKI